VAGPDWGIAVGLLDILKGYAVAQAAIGWGGSAGLERLAGLALVVGHDFSIFLAGRGGKGLAPLTGFFLRLYPLPALASASVFGVARLLLLRWDVMVGFALGSFPVFLHHLAGASLSEAAYPICLLLGLKKLIDLPHDRAVRAQTGWD
jgi:glycerol-3-phosphate acyltransferase PlsY